MASDISPAEDAHFWTLPSAFEEQWKALVHTFGLVEGYPDEPLGNGVLRTPKTFSQEQRQVLVDILQLSPKTIPVPPGSYSHDSLPPPSVGAFERLVGVYERAHPTFGLTIQVKEALDKLARRPWVPPSTSRFLPKEIRDGERRAEKERLAAIGEALKTRPLADVIAEGLGARRITARRHSPGSRGLALD